MQVFYLQSIIYNALILNREKKHLFEQENEIEKEMYTIRIGIGKDPLKGHLWLLGQIDEVAARALILYASQVILARRADNVEYVIELIEIVLARKQRLVVEHLGEYASDRPHVYGLVVALRVEHDLGRTIPTRRHVLGQEARVIVVGIGDARQPEVAYLQVAVRVQQQIARLEVTMQHVRRMNVLETAQDLI